MHNPRVGDLLDLGRSVYYRISAIANSRITAESWAEKKRVYVSRKDVHLETGKWKLKPNSEIREVTPEIFSENRPVGN